MAFFVGGRISPITGVGRGRNDNFARIRAISVT